MPITSKITLPLCRPREPAFVPKLNYRFDIPADHLSTKYKDIGVEILEQYNDEKFEKLSVKSIEYPDLTFLKTFAKRTHFSAFNPQHMSYATELMKIFDSAKDLDDLISLALYCRDHLNSDLFIYAYYTVLAHRDDTYNIDLPHIFEINPHRFFDKHILNQLHAAIYDSENGKSSTDAAPKKNEPVVIEVAFRGRMSEANSEEKLKFFREDIAVNVYPFDGPTPKYYAKDRRGELFYFMHHQLNNWYDCNRLTAGIPLVVPFDNFRKPIERGIYPELTTATNPNLVSPRQDNVYMQDLVRPEFNIKVADLERWYDRVVEAVDNGFGVDPSGKRINLLDDNGIDLLGNTIEPSPPLSMNFNHYGSLHNFGHRVIAFAHDPLNKYKAPPSVMRDTATALRDHVFYQWHKMVDQVCVRLKDKLPVYQPKDLKFEGVKIKSCDLLDDSKTSIDQLITFWQKSTVDLRNGLDFRSNKPSLITFTHLNYRPFTYSLAVENRNATPVEGTVRIFLLPVIDESGGDFSFNECRKLAILIDQFVCKFSPGANRVKRKSSESSVTIPFNRSFPAQQDGTILLSDQPEDVRVLCMCGWPQHLLFPKGTEDGYPFRICVVISDYKLDKVDQKPSNGICTDSFVLCGLQNRKYPDKRPMGYPFDRPAPASVTKFDDFVKGVENMFTKTITIRHLDENTAQVGNDPNKIVKI